MALRGGVAAIVLLGGLTSALQAQETAPPAPAEKAPSDAPAAPEPAAVAPTGACSFKLEDLAWRKGDLSIVPFGYGVFNMNYNTKRLVQGSYALYANPADLFDRSQFNISPQNTFLGVDFTGPTIGDIKTGGRIDFDFRGPTPTVNDAVPFFFDIFGEARTDRWRLLLGQTHDVVSPLDPTVLNFTNGFVGFMPGDIGFFRPQLRVELYSPAGDNAQLILQGALAQEVVQPLQMANDLFGTGAGWPDIQGRVALALGALQGERRPIEIGVSAHVGERVLEVVAPQQLLRHYQTWSFNADARAQLTERTKIQGEFFVGQLLGGYNGGVFQGIDPVTLDVLRGLGGWVELEHGLTERLRGHVGAGIDDVTNNVLSAGRRSSSVVYWTNLYWDITKSLTWAVELSWWQTRYVDLPDGNVGRVETSVIYRF